MLLGVPFFNGIRYRYSPSLNPIWIRSFAMISKRLKVPVGVLLLLLTGCVFAENNTSERDDDSPWTNRLDQLEKDIAIGESATALEEAVFLLEEVESEYGLYHRFLIEPLVVIGDAHLALEQGVDALKAYERAIEIERTQSGFLSIEQKPIAHKAAEAHLMIGDFRNATRMYEKAYQIARLYYGKENPELLPDTIQLLNWYDDNSLHGHEAVLSREVLELASKIWEQDDEHMLELKRSYAKAMFESIFPPQREFGSPQVSTRIGLWEYMGQEIRPPTYFSATKALSEVIEVLEQSGTPDRVLYASTLLELADFHQAARTTSMSFPLYRKAWKALADTPKLQERTFSEPKLLYVNLPTVSNPEESKHPLGYVDLKLTISEIGRVIGRHTIAIRPRNDALEHSVRVALRSARYRPAFRDAQPVRSKNVEFSFYYPLGQI